jgi:hypothetical protein
VDEGDARNLAPTVARAAVYDSKEIRGTDVSKRWQPYCVEPRAKVYVAPKLHKAASAGSVRVNQELKERCGLIVLSGHLDLILCARNGRDRESRRLSWRIGIEFDLGSPRD